MSRYKADLTAGSLKVPDSRIYADLLRLGDLQAIRSMYGCSNIASGLN